MEWVRVSDQKYMNESNLYSSTEEKCFPLKLSTKDYETEFNDHDRIWCYIY